MRALFSVSDKTGLVEFAKGLVESGWEIIATGGTQKLLEDSGVKTTGISDVTGFPEICGGRVKTLHPRVHGGLLGRRDNPGDMAQLKENGIETIDMVCVNLYPFEATVPKPRHYDVVLDEIRRFGNTDIDTRIKLSAKAYTHTAQYDAHIATYMRMKAGLNEKLFLDFDLVQSLRYGENPHQEAKFYAEAVPGSYSVAGARQIQGKELSYNNIQDANAALEITSEFSEPFCCALKHMNPCGAAVGKDALEAWTRAYEADQVSIYGGIVAFNREVTKEIALGLKPIFLEILCW